MNRNLIEKFAQLSRESDKSRGWYKGLRQDPTSQLSAEKKEAWAKMLSSVASAEATEEVIMKPLIIYFSKNPQLKTYFAAHAEDEFTHAKALKDYIVATFNYEKKKRTLSDKVIYDGLFSVFRKFAGSRPLAFIAALFFYESYSERFYTRLQRSAEADGLLQLRDLVRQIEKDELRHRAGLKLVLKEWRQLGEKADLIDLLITKALIGVVKADVNTGENAFHNQRVRKNMSLLDLGPDELFRCAKDYGKKSVAEVQKLL